MRNMIHVQSFDAKSNERTIQIKDSHFAFSVSIHGAAFGDRRIPVRSDIVATHYIQKEMWAISTASALARTAEK